MLENLKLENTTKSIVTQDLQSVNSLLEKALDYADLDWAVLPLHSFVDGKCSCGDPNCGSPGKHPRTPHGVKDATTDPKTIIEWWTKWPDANIGIATGSKSGFFALDVDGEEGQRSLNELQAKYGPLPETLETATGGGGRHLLFIQLPGLPIKNKVRIAPGLDIRGDGGYIVAPPSNHISGKRYEWVNYDDIMLAEAPAWLLDLITSDTMQDTRQQGPTAELSLTTKVLAGVPEGERNNTLFRYACRLRARGLSYEEITSLVLEAARRCNPPLAEKEALQIVKSAWRYKKEDQDTEEKRPKESARLVSLAISSGAGFFHSPLGDGYATVPVAGHRETWPVRSKGFKQWLAGLFYEVEDKPPNAQALQDALNVLEAKATLMGAELPVFTRVAEKDGAIYLDLANEQWQAVEVTPDGWRIISDPPVKFRRTKGMLPLPYPVPGGSIEELRCFVNAPDETTWRLLVAFLVAAMRPTGPYPVLILQGEQGTAKSTTARVLRELVDPSTAPLRTIPKEERDLAIAGTNSWCIVFDNLSGIPNWLSDAICRLVTGMGLSTRTLYENDEETIFSAMRPVILNGIDDLVTRHDLLDRALVLNLPVINKAKRIDEQTFWRAFQEAQPRILGAILDAVAVGLRNIDHVRIAELPRMADFSKWVVACEPALPWPQGGFLAAYTGNRVEAVELALESDPVAVAVRRLAEEKGSWEGTASELLEVLEPYVPENTKKTHSWPKTAQTLSNGLRRAATFLRQTGLEVEFYRQGSGGSRLIRITER